MGLCTASVPLALPGVALNAATCVSPFQNGNGARRFRMSFEWWRSLGSFFDCVLLSLSLTTSRVRHSLLVVTMMVAGVSGAKPE